MQAKKNQTTNKQIHKKYIYMNHNFGEFW